MPPTPSRVSQAASLPRATSPHTHRGPRCRVIRPRTGRTRSWESPARKNIVAVAVSNRAIAYAYNVYERVHKPATYRDVGTVAVILVSQLG